MVEEEAIDYLEELLSRPLFKRWFLEFFRKMQQEGILAAKQFWSLYHDGDALIPSRAAELFEKLIDFYIILGFVPRQRHDRALGENETLKEENSLLMKAMKELRCSFCTAERKDIQKAWHEAMERQIEMIRGVPEELRDFFKEIRGTENEEQTLMAYNL